jgi:hypothetical protein
MTLGTSPVRSYGATGARIQLGSRRTTRVGSSRSSRARPTRYTAPATVLDAVVEEQPAVLGVQRRRPDPDPDRDEVGARRPARRGACGASPQRRRRSRKPAADRSRRLLCACAGRLRAHANGRRKRCDALRRLQPGADRSSLLQASLGRRAQPV